METKGKVPIRLAAVHAHAQADEVIGRALLTGEFPGSTVELNHIFKLSDDQIASLEI
jgi:hypothetical protein